MSTASVPAQILRKSLVFFLAVALLCAAASIGIARLFTRDVTTRMAETAEAQRAKLWETYKRLYLRDGRVIRPKDGGDTVSEGQAYAMLRALWQEDRAAFDAAYLWTEEHLSRRRVPGAADHLLAWHYRYEPVSGEVLRDYAAALDADLDYALALFAAARLWPDGRAPANLPGYKEKALAVAQSVFDKAVYVHPETRELVLLPAPVSYPAFPPDGLRLNPSYFSPGHYRVFEAETGDRRWGRLAEDSYRQFARLLDFQAGRDDGEATTVPDWVVMREDGSFAPDPAAGDVSGWDAFRAWWRLRLDYDLSGNAMARELIQQRLAPFVRRSMALSGGEVAAESDRRGNPKVRYGNAGMAAVYSWALRDFEAPLSRALQRQALRHLVVSGEDAFFQDRDDYYTNSWAWYAIADTGPILPLARFFRLDAAAAAPPSVPEERP